MKSLDSLAFKSERFCVSCMEPLHFSILGSICSRCLVVESPIERLRSLFYYRGAARRLVHSLKYYQNQAALCFFEGAAFSELPSLFGIDPIVSPHRGASWNSIAYAPSYPSSIRQRGLHSTALFGRKLARTLNLPLIELSFASAQSADQQPPDKRSRLMPRKRITTPLERIISSKIPRGVYSCLLIDDVITSGLTALSSAAALQAAGIDHVDVLTLARSPRYAYFQKYTATQKLAAQGLKASKG